MERSRWETTTIAQELHGLNTRLKDAEEGCKNLDIKLARKLDNGQIDFFLDLVRTMPTKDELKTVTDSVKTTVSEFAGMKIDLADEFSRVKAIVARYDEILSEKANKALVLQHQSKFEDEFRKPFGELKRAHN